MGWTKEQWDDFCARLGIDSKKALKSGQAYTVERRIAGEEKAKATRERKAAERKAKGPIAAGVPHAIRELDPNMALEAPVFRTKPQLEDVGRLPRVSITIRSFRTRLLDPDNFIAGCKGLVDGIVAAGIADSDSQEAIAEGRVAFFYEQVLVKSYGKEVTEIEIEWNEQD